jgi:hypothetical protein
VVAAVLYLVGVSLLGAAFLATLLALRNPGSTATRTTGLGAGSGSSKPAGPERSRHIRPLP